MTCLEFYRAVQVPPKDHTIAELAAIVVHTAVCQACREMPCKAKFTEAELDAAFTRVMNDQEARETIKAHVPEAVAAGMVLKRRIQ